MTRRYPDMRHARRHSTAGEQVSIWITAAIGTLVLAFVLWVVASYVVPTPAKARDLGQWENSDPRVRQWFETLMQPDNPGVRCCGEADAYWADKIEVKDGKVYAIITDTRPDGPLLRPHVPPGTRIEVPPHKLKWDRGNPTGHTVIFLNASGQVLCFVQATGI